MTVSYTPEVRAKLEDYLVTHDLPKGLGDEESACSIAAINLALSGEITDDIPDCVSEVLGETTIILQDAMPAEMRNSDRYKAWLPTAVGTGREHEQERLKVLMNWMWETVMPQLQELADENGFGEKWQRMCEEQTAQAAYFAARAAFAVYAADYDAAYAADIASDAAATADAATCASRAAAYAVTRAAKAAAKTNFWQAVDPIGILERMTKIGDTR